MAQTNYTNDFITWTINRTPDYSILNQYYSNIPESNDTSIIYNNTINLTDFMVVSSEYNNSNYIPDNDEESYTHNYTYDYNIRDNMFLQNFIQVSNNVFSGNALFDEDEDFIPLNTQSNIIQPDNQPDNQPINFIVDNLLSPEELNCCICMEEHEVCQICQLNCQHTFCVTCIDQHLARNSTCPLCRDNIDHIITQSIEARQQIHH